MNIIIIIIRGFEDYIKKSKERLITEASNSTYNIKTSRITTKTRKLKWKEKQLYGDFKRQTSEISLEKTRMWQRKENLKREDESFLITAQNNAIRTNCIKAKINNAQENSKCRLCGDKNKMINHIIS